MFAIAVTSLIYVREYPKVIPVLFVTIGFGLVGFLDDYLKVVLHRSDGLMPMQKMTLQIVITAIFAVYIVKLPGVAAGYRIESGHGHNPTGPAAESASRSTRYPSPPSPGGFGGCLPRFRNVPDDG